MPATRKKLNAEEIKNRFMEIATNNSPHEVAIAAMYVTIIAICLRHATLLEAMDELRSAFPEMEKGLRMFFPDVLDQRIAGLKEKRPKC